MPLEVVSAWPAVRTAFATSEQAVFACWTITIERLKSVQLVLVLGGNVALYIIRIVECFEAMRTAVPFRLTGFALAWT